MQVSHRQVRGLLTAYSLPIPPMPILREYLRPATLVEAIRLIDTHGDSAVLLAGGANVIGACSKSGSGLK